MGLNTLIVLLSSFMLLFCTEAEARRQMKRAKSSNQMGGRGFLFSDRNTFTQNPAHLATGKGFNWETQASQQKVNGKNQRRAVSSMALTWGDLGLGAFASRDAMDLFSKTGASDVLGGALALSFAGRRMGLGVAYEKEIGINQTNDGRAHGSLLVNPAMGRDGLFMGVGGSSDLWKNDSTTSAILAVGYSFNGVANSAEATFFFPDVGQTENFIGSIYLNLGHGLVYMGLGYSYLSYDDGTFFHHAEGRLGVMVGKHMDISIFGEKTFSDGIFPVLGATLRFSM